MSLNRCLSHTKYTEFTKCHFQEYFEDCGDSVYMGNNISSFPFILCALFQSHTKQLVNDCLFGGQRSSCPRINDVLTIPSGKVACPTTAATRPLRMVLHIKGRIIELGHHVILIRRFRRHHKLALRLTTINLQIINHCFTPYSIFART